MHWGGRRRTYVVDAVAHRIVGDLAFASADEPYRVLYAGTDVSSEATTSPVDVAAIVFEDSRGGVRAFLGNQDDHRRHVSLEFRGRTERVTLAPGELAELVLVGDPQLVDAMTVQTVPPATAAV